MKLGVTMPTRTVDLKRVPQYAKWGEEAGLDSVWDWELYRNPFTMLSLSAVVTDRTLLGTGLSVAGSRSPFEMANAAADVDDLSGGRMLLGMGAGVTEFLGAFHSNNNQKPFTRMSEYIECLRLCWQYLRTGDAPSFEGEFYRFQSPPFNPWGQRHLEREQIPIYLGAIGPRMLDLVGRKADGWIGYLGTPSYVADHVRPAIARGAQAAGRTVADIDLMLELICCVHPDRDVAVARARKQVGFYVSHPSSNPIVEYAGLTDEVNELRGRMMSEGLKAFEDSSDKLIETFSLTGTPDEVVSRLGEWEGIVDHLVFHCPYVPPFTAQESEDCYRQISSAFKR
jgi:probable F420-dependent oxidoreductase